MNRSGSESTDLIGLMDQTNTDITEIHQVQNMSKQKRPFTYAQWINIILAIIVASISIYIGVFTNEPRTVIVLDVILINSLVCSCGNMLVIYLLFNKVRFIPMSGIMVRNAKRIRNEIASVILTSVVNFEQQQALFNETLGSVVGSFEMEKAIRNFFYGDEFEEILQSTIRTFSSSPEGFLINTIKIDYDTLNSSIKELCCNYTLEATPKFLAMLTSPPFFSNDFFHEQFSRIIASSLEQIPDEILSDIIYSATRNQFSRVVVWGNFLGIFIGLIQTFVLRNKHIYEL